MLLPVPLIGALDGGPYITSGIGISRDPQAWPILREQDRLDREVKTGKYVLKKES